LRPPIIFPIIIGLPHAETVLEELSPQQFVAMPEIA
jgi:hypothetical protein